VRLAEILPPQVKVRLIADRGFGNHKRYRQLSEQRHFDYVIRLRGNIAVTAADGETRTAAAWVRPGGRACVLHGAKVTAEGYEVGTVVCVRETDMTQAWCLATNKALTGCGKTLQRAFVTQFWNLMMAEEDIISSANLALRTNITCNPPFSAAC
jgi:hypothetical protein